MCDGVKYKIGSNFGNKTEESIVGQPLKEKLEEAKWRPPPGALEGPQGGVERENRCVMGAAGREGTEEIKGKSVLNGALGRRGMKMNLPLFPSAVPTSAFASTGSSYRAAAWASCRRRRCFQMRPDAETRGASGPCGLRRRYRK